MHGILCPSIRRAIRWNDPDLAIQWPIVEEAKLILSEKDARAPYLRDVEDDFKFNEFQNKQG